MVHIIDNRDGKADLEIYEDGYGNWYAWNDENDKCIACQHRCDALDIKNMPHNWDI